MEFRQAGLKKKGGLQRVKLLSNHLLLSKYQHRLLWDMRSTSHISGSDIRIEGQSMLLHLQKTYRYSKNLSHGTAGQMYCTSTVVWALLNVTDDHEHGFF